MGFLSPKVPKAELPPPPPPAPVEAPTAKLSDARRRAARLAGGMGWGSTILTGMGGLTTKASTAGAGNLLGG